MTASASSQAYGAERQGGSGHPPGWLVSGGHSLPSSWKEAGRMPVPSLSSRLLAEFVGTFTLIAVGVGVLFNAPDNLLAVAFAHGLAIAVMVTAVGHVSGGHFNPAVSTAM